MGKVFVQYSEIALQFREAINIALSFFSFVLCVLFARFTINEFLEYGYRNIDWTVKASIGLFFIFFGELLRSSTITVILHTEGGSGTYLSDIPLLMIALASDLVGSVCVIRVMTPDDIQVGKTKIKLGNRVWIGSLVTVLGLIAASRFL